MPNNDRPIPAFEPEKPKFNCGFCMDTQFVNTVQGGVAPCPKCNPSPEVAAARQIEESLKKVNVP